jgi:hypothetical protein
MYNRIVTEFDGGFYNAMGIHWGSNYAFYTYLPFGVIFGGPYWFVSLKEAYIRPGIN